MDVSRAPERPVKGSLWGSGNRADPLTIRGSKRQDFLLNSFTRIIPAGWVTLAQISRASAQAAGLMAGPVEPFQGSVP
jgi:hypothetical protein